MAMEAEFALAKKIKRNLEQKRCRGLVVFTNSAGQVTFTATNMTGEAAIGLMTAAVFNIARAMGITPQEATSRISRMLEERGTEMENDFQIKEMGSTLN